MFKGIEILNAHFGIFCVRCIRSISLSTQIAYIYTPSYSPVIGHTLAHAAKLLLCSVSFWRVQIIKKFLMSKYKRPYLEMSKYRISESMKDDKAWKGRVFSTDSQNSWNWNLQSLVQPTCSKTEQVDWDRVQAGFEHVQGCSTAFLGNLLHCLVVPILKQIS